MESTTPNSVVEQRDRAALACQALAEWAERVREVETASQALTAARATCSALPLEDWTRPDGGRADARKAARAREREAEVSLTAAETAVETAHDTFTAAALAAHVERFEVVLSNEFEAADGWFAGICEAFEIEPIPARREGRTHPTIGDYSVPVGVRLDEFTVRFAGDHGWERSGTISRARAIDPAFALAFVAGLGVKVLPSSGDLLAELFGMLGFRDRGES